MELKEKLQTLRIDALQQVESAEDLQALNQVRISYLGKKGPITEALRGMKDLSPEERPVIGTLANELRDDIEAAIQAKKDALEIKKMEAEIAAETIDVTLPGKKIAQGTTHVLTQINEEIEDLFLGMGYKIVDGPEVEQDSYNFEKMNLPKDHPARDMQDTFYITDELLLRTHTSPVQARTMEKHDFSKGPLKMISPGKVYRRDSDDATHSHQFHQIEGLVIGENITLADLKGTLAVFANRPVMLLAVRRSRTGGTRWTGSRAIPTPRACGAGSSASSSSSPASVCSRVHWRSGPTRWSSTPTSGWRS